MLLQTNFCKNQYPWAYKTNLLLVNMVHACKNLLSWVNGMKWLSLLFWRWKQNARLVRNGSFMAVVHNDYLRILQSSSIENTELKRDSKIYTMICNYVYPRPIFKLLCLNFPKRGGGGVGPYPPPPLPLYICTCKPPHKKWNEIKETHHEY